MFNELKQSVSATIKKSSWLEEDSKEYALERLIELFGIFGQPEMYFDPIFLEQFFNSVNLIRIFKNEAFFIIFFALCRSQSQDLILLRPPSKSKNLTISGIFISSQPQIWTITS